MSNAAAAWPYPRWIAHRGAGKLAPENTLAAFRLGAAFGYRAFECDVKLSADGVPFLLHDATLDRTSDGEGPVSGTPWSELVLADAGGWHSRQFAGEPMPSLAAVAAFILANDFVINLEIKPTPGTDAATGAAVAELASVLWAGDVTPPLLSSFNAEALVAARRVAPHLPRALLLDSPRTDWLDEAAELGCVAVVTNHRWMDEKYLLAARAAGLRTMVYTVNEASDAERLLALGIDNIITDAVDLFSPAQA